MDDDIIRVIDIGNIGIRSDVAAQNVTVLSDVGTLIVIAIQREERNDIGIEMMIIAPQRDVTTLTDHDLKSNENTTTVDKVDLPSVRYPAIAHPPSNENLKHQLMIPQSQRKRVLLLYKQCLPTRRILSRLVRYG